MRFSPRNVTLAFNHAGLAHYGGAFLPDKFLRVLQFRHFQGPPFQLLGLQSPVLAAISASEDRLATQPTGAEIDRLLLRSPSHFGIFPVYV